MVTIIKNIDSERYEITLQASKRNVLMQWAKECNYTSIVIISQIRYKVGFDNDIDFKRFQEKLKQSSIF